VKEGKTAGEGQPKALWTRPQLKLVGSVSDVLQGGGAKLSPRADPGDGTKQTASA
jgi:hypothetical protein